MRRFVVALLGLSAMSGAAIAADMPVKAAARILPPTILVYNWTGCYIGGHAGGGWGRTEWTNTANTTTFGDLSPGNGFTQTKSGFVGAGQIAATFRLTNGSSALKAPSPAPASKAMSPMARSAPPSTFSLPGSTSLRPSLAASATPSTIGCPTSRVVMPAPTLSSASTIRSRRIPDRAARRTGSAAGPSAAVSNTASRRTGWSASSTATSAGRRRATTSPARRPASTASTSNPISSRSSRA